MSEAPAHRLPMLDARPRTRGDCVGGPRPCPWASCRFSLLIDVARRKDSHRPPRVVVYFPDEEGEPDLDNHETCVLDIADRGQHKLEYIGELLGGVTRERIRQIEEVALRDPALIRLLQRMGPDPLAEPSMTLTGPMKAAEP